LALARALPVDAVREPEMPIDVFLREGRAVLAGCAEHEGALAAVGVTTEMRATADKYLSALDSTETIWQAERKGAARRTEFAKLIGEGEAVRSDILAAGDLALRKSQEGQERLSRIREGEGLPDLAMDLGECAVLLTDARSLFEAISYPVDDKAQDAARLRDAISAGLAAEDAGKTLSQAKDDRDRVYTLARESISELRAFARFAFRDDRTPARRNLFASDWVRRKNRKATTAATATGTTSVTDEK